ncbi:MAG: dihydroorotate dehydrogenase [Clostridia bacterium]|nr:dihydroorotate dehydrogenase [Clostridia bacterium]
MCMQRGSCVRREKGSIFMSEQKIKNKPSQTVDICGIRLKNPVVTASGTFGFGREFNDLFPINELGAISVKGLTLKSRMGNPTPRIAETSCGILNSVGLQNPGVEYYIKNELPFLKSIDVVVIANIAGNTVEEYMEMARIISESDTDFIELNISCPNVKEGGVAFGTSENSVYNIVSKVKPLCKKPLIVKLSPNVTDIAAIAKAAEKAGADALSLINTLLGMRIDIKTRKPILANVMGGLSGPAVKPVAIRMVYQVRTATKLPIIGMGGIMNSDDAIEFLMAGADAVAVGTASVIDPYAAIKIKNGIEKYLVENNIDNVKDLSVVI